MGKTENRIAQGEKRGKSDLTTTAEQLTPRSARLPAWSKIEGCHSFRKDASGKKTARYGGSGP